MGRIHHVGRIFWHVWLHSKWFNPATPSVVGLASPSRHPSSPPWAGFPPPGVLPFPVLSVTQVPPHTSEISRQYKESSLNWRKDRLYVEKFPWRKGSPVPQWRQRSLNPWLPSFHQADIKLPIQYHTNALKATIYRYWGKVRRWLRGSALGAVARLAPKTREVICTTAVCVK